MKFQNQIFVFLLCVLTVACTKESNPPVDEPTIEEEEQYIIDGALPGLFSVSSKKKVRFSMGNLQHNVKTDEWQFAPSQYCILGTQNENIKSSDFEWTDMFLWGSSGYNYTDYLHGYTESRDIDNTPWDWGVYNKISNGGNQKNIWRTLTAYEWDYIINQRPNSYELFTQAIVGGQYGWVILPDNWETPEGIKFVQFVEFKQNRLQQIQEDPTIYKDSDWIIMEKNGAVFLPSTGYMYNQQIYHKLYDGAIYWTSTYVSDYTRAYAFNLNSKVVLGQKIMDCISNESRQIYLPVRLVKNF